MRIDIKEIESLLRTALKIRNVEAKEADFIVKDYLEAQMEQTFSHGISKFLLIDNILKNRDGKVFIEKRENNYAIVNGNKELGHIAGLFSVELLNDMVKKSGFAMVALNNISRYGRLKPFGELIADKGFVGILMNNGGPSAVTPYNGKEPILGTNPICFAFPSENENIIMDLSTSKYAWGRIRESKFEGKNLPENAFLDSEGNYTRNYKDVNSVIPFGEYKGFAFSLAIEILTGALLGSNMGKNLNSQYEAGYLFLAFDTNLFSDINIFKKDVQKLCMDIRKSDSLNGEEIYIPGDKSKKNLNEALRKGKLEINENVYDILIKMSKSLEFTIKSNNKID